MSKIINEWFRQRNTFFEIHGAGILSLSNGTHLTGGHAGFHVGVDWGDNNIYCGGVLGYEEARRMAEFILEKCNAQTMSEAEIYNEGLKKLFEL